MTSTSSQDFRREWSLRTPKRTWRGARASRRKPRHPYSRQQCHNRHQVCRRQCHNRHQVCSHQCHSSQLHAHQLWLWVKGSQHSRLTAWMALWWSEELKEMWAEAVTKCLQHSPFYLSSPEIWVAMAAACMVCCGIPGLFYSNNNNKDFQSAPSSVGSKCSAVTLGRIQ